MPDGDPRTGPRTGPWAGPGTGPWTGSAGRLAGLGVSQGRAAGPVIRLAESPRLPPPRAVTDPRAEA
ncbi:hypothetical protein ACWEPC_55500, partial [Nonomuraea sp. NPDC004297]